MRTLDVILQRIGCGERASGANGGEDEVKVAVGVFEYGVLVLLVVSIDSRFMDGLLKLTKVGYDETMMDGQASFGLRGSRCQSSSVTNGMNGWISRRP
jgi:hypothetical protein